MAVCGRSRHHPDLPPTVLFGDLRIMCQDWEELYNLPSENLTDPNVLIEMIRTCNSCGWFEENESRMDVRTLVDWDNINTTTEKKSNVPEITHEDRNEDIDEELIIVGGEDANSDQDYEVPMGENSLTADSNTDEDFPSAFSIFVMLAGIVTIILTVHYLCTFMTSRIHSRFIEPLNGKYGHDGKFTPASSYTYDPVRTSRIVISPNMISRAIDRLSDNGTDTPYAARRRFEGT